MPKFSFILVCGCEGSTNVGEGSNIIGVRNRAAVQEIKINFFLYATNRVIYIFSSMLWLICVCWCVWLLRKKMKKIKIFIAYSFYLFVLFFFNCLQFPSVFSLMP